jgi:hypothetical protein
VLLDGVPLLDLPDMLKYVSTTYTTENINIGSGNSQAQQTQALGNFVKVPFTHLDQEDSPAKSLLQRIQNVHLRNVRNILSQNF